MDRNFVGPNIHNSHKKSYVNMLIPMFFILVLFMVYLSYTPKQGFQSPFSQNYESKGNVEFDDEIVNSDNVLDYSKMPLDTNSTGIVSSNNVNSAFTLAGAEDPQADVDIQKYQMDYNTIIDNEIGNDNIKSQKQYSKYVKNSSVNRYLDNDLSANYSNTYGLNLNRQNKASNIAATNSTQIQGIDASEFDNNQAGNIRSFVLGT